MISIPSTEEQRKCTVPQSTVLAFPFSQYLGKSPSRKAAFPLGVRAPHSMSPTWNDQRYLLPRKAPAGGEKKYIHQPLNRGENKQRAFSSQSFLPALNKYSQLQQTALGQKY